MKEKEVNLCYDFTLERCDFSSEQKVMLLYYWGKKTYHQNVCKLVGYHSMFHLTDRPCTLTLSCHSHQST